MDITQLLSSGLGQQMISGIGEKTGTTPKETASVVSAAAPVLLGMLHKNSSSQDGASSLLGALQKHDGSVLDNLSGFFGSAQDHAADGDGILKHVLGDKRGTVENALSQQTGVSAAKVTSILSMLAPLIMGYLGKQTQSAGGVNSSSGLGNILGSLMGGNSGNSSVGGNILGSLLGNALGGSQKSSGGLGGLLGGLGNLFGKK